jgi:inward rectifier potassium channel
MARRYQSKLSLRDDVGQVKRIGLDRTGWTDVYHNLLTISVPGLLGVIGAAYLAANFLFAFAYLAVGGIANARPGSLSDAFFFSIQTMATVGYGTMYPETFGANLIASAEILYGLLSVALSTGVVFARISRPTARVMFSKTAVITEMDGCPTLMFRVANQRRNRIVEAQISVTLLRDEKAREGTRFRRFYDLALWRSRTPMFALTWTVMHPIDRQSPLHGLDPESFAALGPEIACSITGLDDISMQTVHARHVYAAEDIRWGARLVDLFRQQPQGGWLIDYSRFHDTEDVWLEGDGIDR